MTTPQHPAADVAAAVAAYEELRRHALAASPHGGGMAWVWLVREGLATWIDRWTADLAPVGPIAARDHGIAGPPVPPPLHVGIVHVLTTIALSRREAIRP